MTATASLRSPHADDIEPDELRDFLLHVSDRTQMLATMLGKSAFSAVELAGMHQSLVRDLQPYDAAKMSDMIIGLLEEYRRVNVLTRFMRDRNIVKMRRALRYLTSEVARYALTYSISVDTAEYEERGRFIRQLTNLWLAAEPPWSRQHYHKTTAFMSQVEFFIIFMQLPQDVDKAAADSFRVPASPMTHYQLGLFYKQFDKFFDLLIQSAKQMGY